MDERKCKRPNLFCYATEERSQDAMVCWLLSWADRKYKAVDPALHACATRFVEALLGKHGKAAIGVDTVEVRQQDCKIDVLARLNGQHVLLIEDKTVTSDGDAKDKLRGYYDCVCEGKTGFGQVARNDIYPIYVKTGNHPRTERQKVEKAVDPSPRGYKVFDRRDFLDAIEGYRGANAILVDYRDHLQCWENDTESYRNWHDSDARRSWRPWEGFYRYLEDVLDGDAEWGYVHNPKGGFLGFWWGRSKLPRGDAEVYLQLEVDPRTEDGKHDICFKIGVKAGKVLIDLARKWREEICKVGNESVSPRKKLKPGVTMTVAVSTRVPPARPQWKNEWLSFDENGKIDLDRTVENLRKAESVLREAVKTFT